MRYLVKTKDEVFYTDYYDYENYFVPDSDMIVFDLMAHKYTTDGYTWQVIETDHL